MPIYKVQRVTAREQRLANRWAIERANDRTRWFDLRRGTDPGLGLHPRSWRLRPSDDQPRAHRLPASAPRKPRNLKR
jgi:hypothetical protein